MHSMTRYLTPSKLGLLALVSIYAEGVVPNAATIPVLSFLVSFLLPPEHSSQAAHVVDASESHVIPIDRFDQILSHLASSKPGRSIWDLWLEKIWSLDCCDALDTFVIGTSSLLAKTREQLKRDQENGVEPDADRMLISRASPLGVFIRRLHLEYTRIQFHDAVALWQNFIAYRRPTQRAWEKRKRSSDMRSTLDVNLSYLQLEDDSKLAQVVYRELSPPKAQDDVSEELGYSTQDVERLLEFQVGEMQRQGCRISGNMRSTLSQMLASGMTVPSLMHYLSFLDSWRAGDYPSAFDNLHRYFDYTMQSRERTFYQYALLNLAILHADFGCYSEAIPAMQEAISTARENKDMNCLNFCMSWLYHFGKAFPKEMKEIHNTGMLGSEKEGLAFLKAKAKETEMWNLLSTSLLSEAKLGLQNGESIAAAFENVVKASHLNVTKNVSNVVGPQLMLQCAIFNRLGVMHVSWLYGEVFMQCHVQQSSVEDVLKCTCRLAHLLAHRGRYHEAMSMMEAVPESTLRILKLRQYWTFFVGLLKVKRKLHRDDRVAADHMLSQLQGQGAPDLELGLTLSLLRLELFIRQGDFKAALDLLESLAESTRDEPMDLYAQVKLMNYKAQVLDKCGQTQRGFSITMRACVLAYRSRTLPALWESVDCLAAILISLGEFDAAAQILEAVIPQTLECEDVELAARTFSLLVDANMGLAGEAEKDSGRRKELLNKAVELLDTAYGEYEKCQDLKGQCEMMAKKATIMHLVGDLVLANDYAARYLDLKRVAAAEREAS